ncbi:MAG: phenylalanine--tRNA ligase subunit beta [Synechococcus sp. SB0665_bin_28]|nr:phenylalanine--tRNA ligase subunit beta [Synechococcus sp. SB0665_bin_28]MYF20063.1 phenylalanine--tRNA ligase subunit beta [Synechococcus sp. SB0677_bin_5]
MRVSLQWLQELVPCPWPVALLAERLSIAGLEVEDVLELGQPLAGVVVGRVLACEPHPDADKLSLCRVEVGGPQVLQIVCGAPNVRANIHVPVAPVGCRLPAVDLTIRRTRLRGVDSEGMICSLAELGQEDNSAGICVLEEQPLTGPLTPGAAVAPLLGLDDVVLDVAVTANRPDGLSMVGIAREVAALCGETVSPPTAPQRLATAMALNRFAQGCRLFSLSTVENVTIGPSPLWLRRCLERAGLRSINTAVDVTNLVMLETGQPMHAFDGERVTGGRDAIHVRFAQPGENLHTLDGQQLSLVTGHLVVADGAGPVALAGVMGGAPTQITSRTRRILLEAAVFDPTAVRRSARLAGLRSESSSRFERGVAPQATLAAADRAVALLEQLCGGTSVERQVACHPGVLEERQVPLRRRALHRLLGAMADGAHVQDATVEHCLQALGCGLAPTEEGWLVTIPHSRCQDLCREVDLVEEVARLVGYDRFGAALPTALAPGGRNRRQNLLHQLRQRLVATGLQELCHMSLDQGGPGALALANPLVNDHSHLRTVLYTGLLRAAQSNAQQGNGGLWGFEVGKVFSTVGPQREQQRLGAVLCGQQQHSLWREGGKAAPLDFHEALGGMERVLASLGIRLQRQAMAATEGVEPLLHPGRSVALMLPGGVFAGWFGQVHPRVTRCWDLPEDVFLLEAELMPLLAAAEQHHGPAPRFQPFSLMPAAERDLAVVVRQAVGSGALMDAIRVAGEPLLEAVHYLSRFDGGDLAPGTCSHAFRLVFRGEQTLTDAQVEAALATVLSALEERFEAQRRA